MKKAHQMYISIAVLLFLMILVGVLAFRQEAQTINQPDQSSLQIQDEATEVQDGVKTKRQQEHGKLFNGYGSKKLAELYDKGSGEITTEIGPGMTMIFPNAPPFDRQRFLQEIGCDADAVLIGETKGKTSQLTENEDFVFTDYDVKVNQILKNNVRSPINIENNIVVTRIGGKIRYRGRIFTALDQNFRPFKLNSLYLLYLKYIPETDSYRAFPNGSFHLENNILEQLGGKSKVVVESDIIPQFVNRVSSTLTMPCNNSEILYKLQ
jgi:hypothetical protein